MAEDKKRVWVGFGVMILRDGKVLLGQRHLDPEKASSLMHGEGTWTMPGGKTEYHESFEEMAYRETLEETWLKINPDTMKIISITNDIVHDNHFVTIGFLCTDVEWEPQVMEPDEITQRQRFSLDNLPSPIFFPSEKVIKNYLAWTVYKY